MGIERRGNVTHPTRLLIVIDLVAIAGDSVVQGSRCISDLPMPW